MARVVAFVPDLLFGSQVQGALRAAGHEVKLVANEQELRVQLVADGSGLRDAVAAADVAIFDLTSDATGRIDAFKALSRQGTLQGVATLAFYSHVEADTRALAEAAGFSLVIPRSRIAREGADLVARLTGP